MKNPNNKRRIGAVPVALMVIVATVVVTYLAFTKENPFASHYEVDAVVRTANQLRAGSVVRIAGVDVGKVTEIEAIGDDEQAARVTLRITEKGRPIHRDATLKIRPRILLEGNFFVDLRPGSPSSPEMGDGDTIPVNQTAAPVQLDQVFSALPSDTRTDLRTLLDELNRAFSGGGARAVNRTIPNWAPAYRGSAVVNDAMLGIEQHDLSGYVAGAARVAEGLDRNGRQLQSLVADLRTTAAAFAREDTSLERALVELPRLLRTGRPALAELNRALPSVRRFARAFRPGVRSSGPALEAQLPFVRQLRGLVSGNELRGLTTDLRVTVPALAQLNKATIPLLEQVRAASSCQNEVILPWTLDKIEDPDFPAIGPVYEEQTKPLVGLAGESRTFDANGQWFRVAISPAQFATPLGTNQEFILTDRPLVGANPPKPAKRSPLRPDVPCETQQQPDLRTNPQQFTGRGSFKIDEPPIGALQDALDEAVEALEGQLDQAGLGDVEIDEDPLTRPDLPKLPLVRGSKARRR